MRYAILLLLAVALFLLSLPPVFHAVQASPRTIYLVGYSSAGWNNTNPQINVLPGETVTIVLSSGDGAPHRFLLDLDGDGVSDQTNCPPMVSTNEDPCSSMFTSSSTSVTFTAPNSGTFNYYCTIHYPAMVGTLVVQTPDFTISSSPSSITFPAGQSANSTILIASQNGFSGTVSLRATVNPTGPSTMFNSSSISISSGGSAASRLTISTTSSTPLGSYTVMVNGTSGSVNRQTTVTVTVVSLPPTASATGSFPPTALVGAAVVIVAVVGIAVFLVRRRTVSK